MHVNFISEYSVFSGSTKTHPGMTYPNFNPHYRPSLDESGVDWQGSAGFVQIRNGYSSNRIDRLAVNSC